MSKILIIDGNHTSHRAYHAMSRLTHKGKSVALIYGFLQILGSVNKMFKPKKIYICWDGQSHAARKKILPEYRERDKSLRLGFDPEDFQRQVRVVRRLCKYLGIAQLHDPDHEADDLIYYIRNQHEGERCTIVSGDKDFNQLVDAKTTVWNPGKNLLISTKNFYKTFGIYPYQFVDYLCLLGDSSDKIPGVRGIGEKKAVQFLKTHDSIELFLDNAESMGVELDSISAKIASVYDINRELIDIPYFFRLHNPVKEAPFYKGLKRPRKKRDSYLKLCNLYGIRHFATNKYIEEIQAL